MLGKTNGKWFSTLIPTNMRKRLLFLVKWKRHHTLHWTLIITLLYKYSFKKHLCFYLDGKSDFFEHFQNILKKVNKTISLLRKLQNNLPRAPLVTIHKSLIRPHLDYGEILYDQKFNNSFHEMLNLIQHNAAFATTGAIRGSRKRLFQKPDFDSPKQKRWYKKVYLFFKMIKKRSPRYLFELIPVARQAHMTRHKQYSSFWC